ncbi:methyltransferase-like protein [Paraphaeosphaeria sporulosa]|uniref:Methyltransferas-like protein n=1 Tax=Paraphaeosphaeria sporulosa TaxID=1460663 RepID=A0A177C2H3_9PLEO|nr:methyltransferase-like protein [Paraphaeosphaeria sporulosa]OAG01062.1 methyltransferas-like protein [Paraphaeosphaeria sporulosa]
MSTADQVKEDYHKHAETYGGYNVLPAGVLESQIIKNALGDATGLVILDLGGGSGIHAREAIDAGAQRVDIVDISPEMMKVATDTEKSLGRDGRIRTFEGDVSKPMDHLPLETYDVVMANWVFDHAGTVEVLEGMWQNVVKYLKPGAKFLGIHAEDPRRPSLNGKYGVRNSNFREIPGGIAYTVEMLNDPPWKFEGTSLEISFSGSFELHEKYALENVSVVPYDNTEAVKQDPEFWKLFLEHPFYAVVQGFKKP